MYDLEEIRRKVSLVALAEEAGASFQNAQRLSSCCPLPRHAGDRNNPSAFHIYDHGRRWKCFTSCPPEANGGDLFAFYMAWKGVDFNTALAELAERALGAPQDVAHLKENGFPHTQPLSSGPAPTWQARANQFIRWAQHNLSAEVGKVVRSYLEQERGLWPETWQRFGLGYCPTTLYDDPARWGTSGKKIWLPRGIVIPGIWNSQPWYIKIRRPQVSDALGRYIGAWNASDGLPGIKFGGPRGGQAVLFKPEQTYTQPTLLLVEGEWDAMLTWQWCQDLCDVCTLGGAQSRLDVLDLLALTRYLSVIVVYDDDLAGDRGREYIAKIQAITQRVVIVDPPAHDLTDYWKGGGNLRSWVAGYVADAMDNALVHVDPRLSSPVIEHWQRVAAWARQEKSFRCPDPSPPAFSIAGGE